ncbi:hypothetical protein TCAL_08832 [Tigriopus californicus]|uniref:Cuticle protein n=1 Tax=Tigriopus californicus TaxID=6832 RepID=A0A553PQA3_TIGCA|nr:adhesive plaque matrix protein-like [Tigriopus californicus]TRY79846.1 hypothetical protein TCAL_08832 [Tigriopus californicus]|eukprot:TCALIF_08832-PA protein Name:"Similar to resilin Pro-resilin (Drosophila melanogaster)" AED:0.05 eAED:0.05 QI:339/1/0.5/1/1/1/2/0/146
MKTFIATLGLVALAVADNAPRYEPRYQPSYKPSYEPSYKQPSYKEEPASYQYNYEVKDEYAGLNFDANEAREGYNTNGGYNVLLPDGRTQKVTYTVDGYGGYVADVQYEGELKYESYKPKYEPKYQPYKPTYKPAYKPAYPQPSYE